MQMVAIDTVSSAWLGQVEILIGRMQVIVEDHTPTHFRHPDGNRDRHMTTVQDHLSV